jgi:hypothetical protein
MFETRFSFFRIRYFILILLPGACLFFHTGDILSQPKCTSPKAVAPLNSVNSARHRRVIYNFDGDSCMWTRAGGNGPVATDVDDMKTLIKEIAYKGSQVDTMLVCINAQVVYYPTKVGTMRGTQCTPEQREKWSANEKQRFTNMKSFFDNDLDPYAIMLAEAKQRGLEALLTFRMNDAHGNDFLKTKFWIDHPEYRLGGALDFAHDEVRDYVFHLIKEAVQRYDCDGIELDFNRFPTFFKNGTTEERITKMNALVERVHIMLDEEGKKRKRHLVLAARIPSNYGKTPPSYETSRKIGCDPAAWAKNGWIDFLTISEFLYVRYDLPIAPWKKLITEVPIYGGIECIERQSKNGNLTAQQYLRAARNRWKDGADGIYIFNFFTAREHNAEPPFEVLSKLGNRDEFLQNIQKNNGQKNIGKPSLKFSHVIKFETDYYATGPQQGRPADGKFPAGTKISIIQKAGSYMLVQSENGIKAYVATDAVKQSKKTTSSQ